MHLSLIAAIAKNNVIGNQNTLPWHIPEDLQHFKKITKGHTVLMGRKTWESIPEKFRPLPERTNIVITRNAAYPVPSHVEVYTTLEEACAKHPTEEIMVIGGADMYRQTIDKADTLFITHIDQEVVGDAFFPPIDLNQWKEIEREPKDGFSFVTYKKI